MECEGKNTPNPKRAVTDNILEQGQLSLGQALRSEKHQHINLD